MRTNYLYKDNKITEYTEHINYSCFSHLSGPKLAVDVILLAPSG